MEKEVDTLGNLPNVFIIYHNLGDNMSNEFEDSNLPDSLYICKNQNRLKAILKEIGIDKNKTEIIVNIKGYPCFVSITDFSLEMGKVFVYGIDKKRLEGMLDKLKMIINDKQGMGENGK